VWGVGGGESEQKPIMLVLVVRSAAGPATFVWC
jgi:hypothetical protein